ncbi:TRAP transporter substrate-binding protein [Acuticoccus yangtzensis]|uniref:TRAP transporter substrate-binding protein n=1 Tax=Acuticoccus yangtzensis TaxID=1443441 RepID=UPI0009498F76|nr:TRAP transporter substrate-binding protein [Acuticoccus yangtzensis]ORE96136.1 TRAP transporter solute receptor [Stappia sp. 22II-S9-Z10]
MLKSALLASAVFVAAALPASAQEVTIRLHSFSSPTALDHTMHLDRWAEAVEAESDGRIDVQVFPAMQLGGAPADLVQQLEDGVVDMIWTVSGFTPGRFTGTQGLELPFMHTGKSATMSPAAMEFIEANLAKEMEGIKVIAVHATDGALFHTKGCIASMDDLAGKQIRVSGKYIGEAVKALGGTPVGIALPGVYEATARGQVDGMLLNWAITKPYKFTEVTDCHTEPSLYQTMLMTLMSQDSYDAMPDDLKAVIDANSGIEYAKKMGEIWDSQTEPARNVAIEVGNEIVTLSPEELAKWKETVKPVYQMWADEMTERGYDGDALLASLLEITAKYGRE